MQKNMFRNAGRWNAAGKAEEFISMNVRARYLGGKKFEMTARNHRVASDQPLDNDGADSAMTPPELFLSSLGACAAYYAAEYLRARGLPHEELEIRVSGEKGDRPAESHPCRWMS